MAISFNLNGSTVSVQAEPDTPLLWVIRDEVGLTGTKYGCGISQCGACTVHVNGAPVRACQRRLQSLSDASVTTIEGLHPTGAHPLQVAWREIDVPQCGYCQSGQVMSAVALLSANATPSDADINTAMQGNLCRCGAYPRIRAAIHRAAEALPTRQQRST